MNQLYYGDNLQVLRHHIRDESVDLIYLDPPFNSKRDYNLLFKSPKGAKSEAQIEAFEDTWHWSTEVTEREYDEVLKAPNSDVGKMMKALVEFIGRNDMTAYLVMMANRLLELHRVLKPTGSLYLHCDPVASHYLKIVLDAVFGKEQFRSEIIWKRTSAHSNVYRAYGDVTDTIFFYSKTDGFTWNQLYRQVDLEQAFPKVDEKGRRWRSENMRNPGVRPNLTYSYKASNGITYEPHANGWTISLERMKKLDAEERLHFPTKPGGRLRLKLYADESPGIKLQSLWDDIGAIGSQASERLGYPTQKPLALLERIVAASSNAGDLILDPFCGCGTAVHAAQKLGRKWIGIDITCLAISLIESRLKKAFPEAFGEEGQRRLQYEVIGTPKDLESARDLAQRDKYQFQWWAVSLVDEAQPWQGKKKGADTGIDGIRYFRDLDRKEVHTILISVKGGENVGPTMVKDLIATLARDKADIGLFITLTAPTKAMVTEAAAAGFYESPNGKKYARLQLFTIEGLLSKRQRPEHPDYEPNTGYKKATAEAHGHQEILL
jgi:site-specific DNA-methyltransferase (adenine-specific)